jgi:hypothetical protein
LQLTETERGKELIFFIGKALLIKEVAMSGSAANPTRALIAAFAAPASALLV